MGLIVKLPQDQNNRPDIVIINGFQLPGDTIPEIDGSKVLVNNKIIDGVNVTTRILRDPYNISFEGTFTQQNDYGTVNANGNFYVFPQQLLNNAWKQIWIPDSVLNVQNSYLNALGVTEIIIKSFNPSIYRGSTNIGFRIEAIENLQGQTLIIS